MDHGGVDHTVSGSRLEINMNETDIANNRFSYPEIEPEERPTEEKEGKEFRWMRKLLDISARNPLLNVPASWEGSRAVVLYTDDESELYRRVLSSKGYRIAPRTEEIVPPEKLAASEKELALLSAFTEESREYIANEAKAGVLHSIYGEETTERLLNAIRRNEKDLAAQTGGHALYLTFGAFRWTDPKSGAAYDAPLILVPARLENNGKNFRVAWTGDAVLFNEAVTELLHSKFEIRPKGIKPVPLTSDRQPDLDAILAILQKAAADGVGLSVTPGVTLGLYSFGLYVLWNDLKENRERFLAHPLVNGIRNGCLVKTVPEKTEEHTLYLPAAADATQIEAVKAALDGESFVMHGPPGTGKSQTITVMLSNLMAAGKTVLFAAEKTAALDVVYDRLDKIGLKRYCLYLDGAGSKTSEKAAFLQQMREILEDLDEDAVDFDQAKKQKEDYEEQIEGQIRLLHGERVCGYSAYELLSQYMTIQDAKDDASFDEEWIETLTRDQVGVYEKALEELMEAVRQTGVPSRHPLRDWGRYEYQVAMQKNLRPYLENYQLCLSTYQKLLTQLSGLLNIEMSDDADAKTDEILKLSATRTSLGDVPAELLAEDEPVLALRHYLSVLQYLSVRENILKIAKEDFLTRKGSKLLSDYSLLRVSSDPVSRVRFSNLKAQIVKDLKGSGWDVNKVSQALRMLVQFQNLPKPAGEPFPWRGTPEQAKAWLDHLEKLGLNGAQIRRLAAIPWDEKAKTSAKNLSQCRTLLDQASHLLEQKSGIDLPLWHKGGHTLTECLAMADRWLTGLDSLREWSDYQLERDYCRQLKLDHFVDQAEQGADLATILKTFRADAYAVLLDRLYEKSPQIRQFTGYHFENLVEKYAACMEEYRKVSARAIRDQLAEAAKQLKEDPAYAKELTDLRKMIESNGKGMSLREMTDHLPRLLGRLKPCIFVSPMSAASFLGVERDLFDVLIFDEASQLKTCKAIGLIARAQQTIVGGDPNQMPPTSFFDTTVEDDSVTPLEDDQESILQDCRAVGMKDYCLKWHYRSHHESLIAFSNSRYYGNQMITFPSADNRISRVRTIWVGGLYERGKGMRNREEAEAIVKWLKETLTGGDTRSMGIVTFNKNQKDLIDRLIEKEAKATPDFQTALDAMEERGEGLFVRNLETVQGDERDVILFSVGYGKDEEGKVLLSFGPLSLAGGYRRLNVAITRARDEMILFSSFPVNEVRANEGTAKAVKDFLDFLKYAGGDRSVIEEKESLTAGRDGFQEEIVAFLQGLGYECDRGIGNSGLKVDIGVIDPEEPGKYCLGIVTNNEAYYENKSVYDREVGQFALLKSRGWRILRIWSIDWWDDPHREQTRIRKALEAAAAAGSGIQAGH